MTSQPHESRSQRQDSLEDQMRDVMRKAVEMGCYDAHDWLLRNYLTHAQRAARAADCPGKHGTACCGFPRLCSKEMARAL